MPPAPAGASASLPARPRTVARHEQPTNRDCSIHLISSFACNTLTTPALLADGTPLRAASGDRLSSPERLQLATCEDWRAASIRHRIDAIDAIKAIVAGRIYEGPTLRDAENYDSLDVPCRSVLARGFLLYELYTRAVAFATHAKPR